MSQPPPPKGGSLTERQVQVLSNAADGMTWKESAKQLGLSPHTVKHHIAQCIGKLGAKNTAHAVALWLRASLVQRVDALDGNSRATP